MTDANGAAPVEASYRGPLRDRSHTEIWDKVAVVERKADDAAHRTDMLHQTVQRVEGKLDELLKTVGAEGEDERGGKVGTGLVGRVMRLETYCRARFRQYDRWTAMGMGALAAMVFLAPLIWWLAGDKLAAIFQ